MPSGFRFYEDHLCIPTDYTAVPIAFRTSARLEHEALKRGEFVETPIPERTKDYDSDPSDGIVWMTGHFDTRFWQSFGADDARGRAAGLVVARRCPEFEMLERRADLAVIVDVRVRPDVRGKGLGRSLMRHALEWCNEAGCREAKVETQDINVAACRFYHAMGFHVDCVDTKAYAPQLDEVQVLWRKSLTRDGHGFPNP